MTNVPIEGVLWLLLALLCLYKDEESDVSIITILHVLVRIYLDVSRNKSSSQKTKHAEERGGDVVYIWRNPTSSISSDDAIVNSSADTMGMYMSITLVPILFESMAILLQRQHEKYRSSGSYIVHQMKYHQDSLHLHLVAVLVAILQIFFWNMDIKNMNNQQLWKRRKIVSFTLALFFLVLLLILSFTDALQALINELWFCYVWLCIVFLFGPYQHASLQGIMTRGEWLVISCVASFICSSIWTVLLKDVKYFLTGIHVNEYQPENKNLANVIKSTSMIYAYTSIAGVLGCIAACSTVNYMLQFTKTNQLIQNKLPSITTLCDSTIIANILRIIYIAFITLGIVECTFWYSSVTVQRTFPKCLQWIVYDFLYRVEQVSYNTNAISPGKAVTSWVHPMVVNLPRLSWLMYWLATMLVTIPIAPATGRLSPVIARKWFHFIATLLFVPSTILVPQLQSLSYAVAICVLLIIEVTRIDIPELNKFYYTYLDQTKDEADSTKFVISHIALVAGCAIPLWIIQYYSFCSYSESKYSSVSNTLNVLVALWGVWVLGVGDAMGALIGKSYGRIKWGYNSRTMEGSAAMFLSLSLVCIVTTWCTSELNVVTQILNSAALWLPAVLFVTLIEAYTLQIDNIVLPLAGTAMILVCHTYS